MMNLSSTFRFTDGEPRRYASSADIVRSFCPHCGTPLSWQGSWHDKDYTFVYIGTLDDPAAWLPERHAFTNEAIVDIHDDLPRYSESSPE